MEKGKYMVVVSNEFYGDETYVEEITANEEGIKKYLQKVQRKEYKNYRYTLEKESCDGDVAEYDDGSYSCHLCGDEDHQGFMVQIWAFPCDSIRKETL